MRLLQTCGCLVTTVIFLTLSGCSDSELKALTDSQLQERSYECNLSKEQTPGQAITCDNYRRECQRRRDEGRYVC